MGTNYLAILGVNYDDNSDELFFCKKGIRFL